MDRRFYIADSKLAAQHYDELQVRLREEWPKYPAIGGVEYLVPQPLVALTTFAEFAGGLAFIAAKSPHSPEVAVWINGILVASEYRRQGVGSLLIRAAQQEAARIGVRRLYALTELPILYSKLGWSIVSNTGADFVMAWAADVRSAELATDGAPMPHIVATVRP